MEQNEKVTSYTVADYSSAKQQVQMTLSTPAIQAMGAEAGDTVDVYRTERGIELVPRKERRGHVELFRTIFEAERMAIGECSVCDAIVYYDDREDEYEVECNHVEIPGKQS